MSSIMRRDINKPLTVSDLKDLGFRKTVWGSPEFVWGQEKNKDNDHRGSSSCLKHKWATDHECWEKEFLGIEDSGVIYYFPTGFAGYVTRWHGVPPSHTIFVVPDNMDEEVYEGAVYARADLVILLSNIFKTYDVHDDEDDF